MSLFYSSSGYTNLWGSWSWWDKDHHSDNNDWCYTSIAPIAVDDPGSSQNTVFLGRDDD